MSRREVRDLKRTIRSGDAAGAAEQDRERGRASALALLDRSIKNGHGRLALIRLATAIRLGARITAGQWAYCGDVVRDSSDADVLRRMVVAAAARGETLGPRQHA